MLMSTDVRISFRDRIRRKSQTKQWSEKRQMSPQQERSVANTSDGILPSFLDHKYEEQEM